MPAEPQVGGGDHARHPQHNGAWHDLFGCRFIRKEPAYRPRRAAVLREGTKLTMTFNLTSISIPLSGRLESPPFDRVNHADRKSELGAPRRKPIRIGDRHLRITYLWMSHDPRRDTVVSRRDLRGALMLPPTRQGPPAGVDAVVDKESWRPIEEVGGSETSPSAFPVTAPWSGDAGPGFCVERDTATTTTMIPTAAPTAVKIHGTREATGVGSLAMRARTRAANSGDGSTASALSISRSMAEPVSVFRDRSSCIANAHTDVCVRETGAI